MHIIFNRCSVNATPQQMSQAEKAVEKFIRSLGQSKSDQKPMCPNVVEVRQPLTLHQLTGCPGGCGSCVGRPSTLPGAVLLRKCTQTL